MVKATVGLAVGMLSIFFPQTLFWGEGSLQHVLDGQATMQPATPCDGACNPVWCGACNPMWWRLQPHVLDGQATPLTAVWPGLSPSLTRRALVDPALPFGTPLAALQVGAAIT